MRKVFHGMGVLLCAVAVFSLSACKSGSAPGVQETDTAEESQARTAVPAARPKKQVSGTQLGGARQGVTLSLKNAVSTIAGRAGKAGTLDGPALQAMFDSPRGITTDGVNLYLADSNNHTIRKLELESGMVTTLAGAPGKKGSNDGKGALARFNRPVGITTDGNSLYVADSNNHTVRQVDPESGMVTTVAGGAGEVGYVDGSGKRARFFIPEGITSDGSNLYISDTHNHSIRRIALGNKAVTTLAGLSGAPGFLDEVGGKARFAYPKGITTDGNFLYVVDFGSHQIRKISIKSGAVITFSGEDSARSKTAEKAEPVKFNYPSGLTTDGRNLYVTDTFNRSIRKIAISSGVVTHVAGAADSEGSADGIGTDAHFKDPVGITTDGDDLYVTDSSHHTIRKIR